MTKAHFVEDDTVTKCKCSKKATSWFEGEGLCNECWFKKKTKNRPSRLIDEWYNKYNKKEARE